MIVEDEAVKSLDYRFYDRRTSIENIEIYRKCSKKVVFGFDFRSRGIKFPWQATFIEARDRKEHR